MIMAAKIITHHEYPPISVRNFDWNATRDGWEPGAPIGWGTTAQDAIQDLLDEEEANASAEDEMYLADIAYQEAEE
jgi:hypothetical protein